MHEIHEGLANRAAKGALIGSLGGFLLLGFGFAAWLLSGSPGDPVTLDDLLFAFLYVVGAAGAGVIGGILYPWTRTRSGSVLVGMVAIQPFLWGVMKIMEGTSGEPLALTGKVVVWIIMTLTFGPVIGLSWIRGWSRSAELSG